MGKYTLHVEGQPIDDAREVLRAADGIRPAEGGAGLVVTVDAPTLSDAESRLRDALPSGGSYSVARPEPLEDEED